MSHGDAMDKVAGLYGQHHGWLTTWLRGKLGNADHAADLAHDTFLRLISRPSDVHGLREARAYLTTVARGLVVDHWRRREIERAWLETLALQPEATAPSEEHKALVFEALCQVDAMLARLSVRARSAFILAQVHGHTYGEIALQLGVSERMVKKYMAQAMLHCIALDIADLGELGNTGNTGNVSEVL